MKSYKMAEIQIIDPTAYPNWDDLLLTHPETTFFHTAAWARVLSESYGYKPLYFTMVEDDGLAVLIAVMEISSPFTGKRGVSLPFTDECHPIAKNDAYFDIVMKRISEYGNRAGWKHIQIRGGQDYFKQAPANTIYCQHTLKLSSNTDLIFKGFKDSVKRNIKRAQKKQIQLRISKTNDGIDAFWKLNCLTRRSHGLPPQPLRFFKNVFKHVIAQGKGFVALALHRAKTVAGAVYFHWNKKAIYKYGASDRRYLDLRPNNLIMWEAIKRCAEGGYRSFDFGRTETENTGLMQFKRGWGADKRELYYFKYDLRKHQYVSAATGTKSSYVIFKHLPLPVLRLTGSLLYRHVG